MQRSDVTRELKVEVPAFKRLCATASIDFKDEYSDQEVERLRSEIAQPNGAKAKPQELTSVQGAPALIQAENTAIGTGFHDAFAREKGKNRQIDEQTTLLAEHIAEERAVLLHPQTFTAKVSRLTLEKLGGDVPPLELPDLTDLMVPIAPVFELPGCTSSAVPQLSSAVE